MPNMSSGPSIASIFVIILFVLIIVGLVRCIYVVQQSRAFVVERLGAFSAVWQVGDRKSVV